MTAIIQTENICRNFKSGGETIQALKNINVSIEQGKLTILRGRSGSGKTTLINLLGAIDLPDSGTIYFDKRDITTISSNHRDRLRRAEMGFVFQSGGLLYNMSAYENVEFALRVAGYEAKERQKRAEECLKLVGLGKRINHRPSELSGGEQQRVAIARAIAHRPRLIFADEPTAALDTNMGLQIIKTFKELVEDDLLTVVMTTHDPNMMEIADTVVTLADGVIVNE